MKLLRSIALMMVCAFSANASHMIAGEITYTHLGGLSYEVTVVFYKDCDGFVTMGPWLTIGFSSASLGTSGIFSVTAVSMDENVTNLCQSMLGSSTCDGGSLPGVLRYIYKGVIVLPSSAPDWIFHYEDCCRNAAITNIDNPDSYGWRIEALVNTNMPSNSSPVFPMLQLPTIYVNTPYQYSYAGFDPDGDSLVYSLVYPIDWLSGTPITYVPPLTPATPLFTQSGSVSFNAQTGQISFTPSATQVAIYGIRVDEYRNGVLIGSLHRDIQLVVVNGVNNIPSASAIQNVSGATLAANNVLHFCTGTNISFEFTVTDPDPADAMVYISDGAFDNTGLQITKTGSNPAVFTVSGTTSLPGGFYSLPITIKDNHCPVPGYTTVHVALAIINGATAGPDVTLCEGHGIQLSGAGGTSFSWSPNTGLSNANIANPMATPLTTTTYTLTTNATGCPSTDEIVVTVVPDFSYSMTASQYVCVGSSVILDLDVQAAGQPYAFFWSPAAGLNAPDVQQPEASPQSLTAYVVTITSNQGCVHKDTVNVYVSPALGSLLIEADPPAICPGGFTQLSVVMNGSQVDCIPTSNCSVGDVINYFSFNTLVNGNSGCSPNAYQYFAGGPTTTVQAGSTYPVAVQSSPAWGQGFRVWIDFNQDGSFDGIGESVYSSPNSSTQLFTGNITIPANAMLGVTRMRVIGRYAMVPTPMEHCGNSTYGECEDYDITIGSQLPLSSYQYSWSPAASLSNNTIASPLASPVVSTTYTLTVTDSLSGCSSSYTVPVAVTAGGSAQFSVSPPTIVACSNQPATVTVTGSASNSYTVAAPFGTSTYSGDFTFTIWDTTGFSFTIAATNSSGCVSTQTLDLIVDSECVWPGDCDYDGIVSYADMLPVAVGFGGSGPVRNNASILFYGQSADNWSTSYGTVNFKHSDTDGNGLINDNDTLAIALNDSLSHLRLSEATDANDSLPALSIDFLANANAPGDWVTALVSIGSNGQHVENLYGISYTLTLDPQFVDLAEVSLSYANSWLAPNGNRLNMISSVSLSGVINTAVARVNQSGIDGAGTVGILEFRLRDDAPFGVLPVTIQSTVAIDPTGAPLDFNESNIDTLLINGLETPVRSIALVYPNPADSRLFIASSEQILGVSICDAAGRELVFASPQRKHHSVDISALAAGTYLVRIETIQSFVTHKVVVIR